MSRQASRAVHSADLSLTERRNPRTVDIDLASPLEIVDLMAAEDAGVPAAVAGQRQSIARAIEIAETTFRAGGRLLYVGAGTSGRLGVLDASECPPTFGTDPELVQGIIAGGLAALTRAQEGAEDRVQGGAADLETHHLTAKDFVIGIAASATTPYVTGALVHARARGAHTGLVACALVPPDLLDSVDVSIVAVVGPEVITGSTRLKAGTATKLVLNMITTGAMIRLGKTYGNLMVDLRATNAKLRARSARIIADVCGVTEADAHRLLDAADGSVKTAIVMQALSVDRVEAESRLNEAGGVVRRVLPGPPPAVP